MNDETDIRLYAFSKRDPLTGKWYRARYRATLEDIERIGGIAEGEPEIRRPLGIGNGFQPFRDPIRQPAPLSDVDMQPTVDDGERFIARAFLRRYVTYCARRGRFAQAQGAARLWGELRARS